MLGLTSTLHRALLRPTSVVKVYNAGDSSGLATHTFSSATLGVEATDRTIVVGYHASRSGDPGAPTITVNGVGLTNILSVYNNNSRITMASALVPSGTTVTITCANVSTSFRSGIGVWAIYGLASSTPTSSASDITSPLSQALTIPANGVGVGVMMNNGAGQTCTWSGLTEDYDATITGGGGSDLYSGASLYSFAGASPTVVADRSGASSNDKMIVAAFV